MTTTAVIPSVLTWEQFLELLDEPEYKNAELVDGQVIVNTPTWLHQRIATALIALMWNWIRAGDGRGEVTFNPPVRIAHDRGYLPDVAWHRGSASRPGGSVTAPTGRPTSRSRCSRQAPERLTWRASAPTTRGWVSASCG